MKYLKTFENMIYEGREIYNKSDMIGFILDDMGLDYFTKDEQEQIRRELELESNDKFDEMAEQLGYKKISRGHWVFE